MDILAAFLIAVGLSMDAFAVSVCKGMAMNAFSRREANLMGLFFGGFQALMPLIGWGVCVRFAKYVMEFDHWIAFGLLLFIGGKMIWESFSDKEEQHFNPRRLHTQLLLAVATSIDALAIGISFACTGYTVLSQLTLPLIIIGIVSFLFSLIGYHLGRRFGKTITKRMKPELIGGLILIGIGLKILLF